MLYTNLQIGMAKQLEKRQYAHNMKGYVQNMGTLGSSSACITSFLHV